MWSKPLVTVVTNINTVVKTTGGQNHWDLVTNNNSVVKTTGDRSHKSNDGANPSCGQNHW